jgi:hypothetical protein
MEAFWPAALTNSINGSTRLTPLHLPIKLLQNKKRLLLLAVIRDQTFPIEIILKMRESPSRTAKILKDPWRSSTRNGMRLSNAI